MPKQNYKTQSKDAASVAKRVYKIVDAELDKVESGKSLTCKVKVFPESRFPNWATTFASMICTNPELTKLKNERLAALIENEDGETGFNHSILSKDLSAHQLQLAREILLKHGYATDTLVKGTDIKRIVKNDLRTETEKGNATKFYHDSVEIDGTKYKYKLRGKPSGNRISDLRIRMQGSDMPLAAVLKLRSIGANEFYIKDEQACQFSLHEHTVERPQREEKSTQTKSMIDILKSKNPTVDSWGYTGTQMFEFMKTWYLNFSPARRQTATFHEFMNGMKYDPEFMSAMQKFVKERPDQCPDKVAVTKGRVGGEYISDTRGNLIDISTLRKLQPYKVNPKAAPETTATPAFEECLTA